MVPATTVLHGWSSAPKLPSVRAPPPPRHFPRPGTPRQSIQARPASRIRTPRQKRQATPRLRVVQTPTGTDAPAGSTPRSRRRRTLRIRCLSRQGSRQGADHRALEAPTPTCRGLPRAQAPTRRERPAIFEPADPTMLQSPGFERRWSSAALVTLTPRKRASSLVIVFRHWHDASP